MEMGFYVVIITVAGLGLFLVGVFYLNKVADQGDR